MKSCLIISTIAVLACSLTSCKKQAGIGGTSSIKGNLLVRQYDLSFSSFDEEYPGADEDVFIIYGDNITYADRIRSSYDGAFEFKYLRQGQYKIYVYSQDSAAIVGPPANPNAPKKAIVVEVEISGNRQAVDLGTITILKNG